MAGSSGGTAKDAEAAAAWRLRVGTDPDIDLESTLSVPLPALLVLRRNGLGAMREDAFPKR